MSATRPANAKALPRNTTKELDIYAAEFAKLVDRHSPTRSDTPTDWLRRLPDEAYRYFQEGISTFGSDAKTPIERRGRLYLIHSALLFMWMSWGKDEAREDAIERSRELKAEIEEVEDESAAHPQVRRPGRGA